MLSRNSKGSVTVVFTLVFIIILSVVGTILEAARLQSAAMVISGDGQSALEAVYTGYARELFEDYGIFLLHEKYLPEGTVEEQMKKYLEEDLQESFLYQISVEDLALEEQETALQDGVEGIKKQMLESVRYDEVKQLYNCITESTGILEDSSRQAKEVSEGLDADDDEDLKEAILALMEAVDGVRVRKDTYSIVTPFVKQFVPVKKEDARLSISSAEVLADVEAKCYFAGSDLEDLERRINSVEKLLADNGKEKKKKKEKKAIQKKMQAGADAVKNALEGIDAAQSALGEITSANKKRLKLTGMEKALASLEEILSVWNTAVEDCKNITVSEEEYARFLNTYLSARDGLKKWNVQSLGFDYSGLGTEEENPLDSLKSLLENSLLQLVTGDTKELSKEKIVLADTVSAGRKKENSWQKKDYGSSLKKSEVDDADDEVVKQLDAYSEKAGKNKNGLAQGLMEKVLISQYIRVHFGSYVEAASDKETALQYEMGYILCGKSGDMDNLSSTVNMISGLRTPLNLVYLLKNKTIRAKAKATATAVLGLCGLPALVKAGEYMILLCLAYEEALVDTAALLQGRRVPMTKNAKSFHMAYEELFTCSSKLIQKKARSYSKEEKGLSAGFTYGEMLCFFMAAMNTDTLCYRALDLIQENMRRRYDSSYVLKEGILRSKVSIGYNLPQKALSLPVGNILEFMGYRKRRQVQYGYALTEP